MKSKQIHGVETQEQIPCFLTPPWRQDPTTYIDATAERARARHDKEHAKEDSLSIYTDGSGIEGEMGSAALCPLTQQLRSAHMGQTQRRQYTQQSYRASTRHCRSLGSMQTETARDETSPYTQTIKPPSGPSPRWKDDRAPTSLQTSPNRSRSFRTRDGQ
jgi:hypothetical protein